MLPPNWSDYIYIYISVLGVKSAKHWYHVLILDYCDARLNGLSLKNINKLQRKVQKCAVCLVLRMRKRQHITPALKISHWLPVQQRIQCKTSPHLSTTKVSTLWSLHKSQTFSLTTLWPALGGLAVTTPGSTLPSVSSSSDHPKHHTPKCQL